MATYSVDADITNAEPSAASYLPLSDSGLFTRLRNLAYAEINRQLARRNPPIDAPSDLADQSELTHAEVCHVLRDLYQQSASRAGSDTLWENFKVWSERWQKEIDTVPVTVDGSDDSGMSMGGSIEIGRS